MHNGNESAYNRSHRDLAWALVGLIVAVFAARLDTRLFIPDAAGGSALRPMLAYLATWIPMLAAIAAACTGLGWRASVQRLGLHFHPFDLLWGIAAGCFVRAVDAIARLQLMGTTGLEPQPTLGAVGVDGWLIMTGILAPVMLGPLIEEIFFRGLLQRSLVRSIRHTLHHVASASIIAVLATSVLFSLVHFLVGTDVGIAAVATAIGTFAFSLAAGFLTAATGRIGGAIVAHIVFNGVAVLLLWPR